ncbi:MAG: hypothetical protein KDA92_17225 [Planctomycetales bacterium]|nr:hypothetical protein [Planctomycetales bacterium]MCA9171307.1 hypothetical protein [Planctomycetales bacterium]
MPRLSKSLPKYRKHRASGQAIVTLNGHDFYLGPHGSKASVAEYDRLTAEWLANGRSVAGAESVEAFTVTELAARFWKHVEVYT